MGLPARILALGRLRSGDLNKTEAAYRDHLVLLKSAGEIQWFEFEPVKLRLADNTFYSPDFGVLAKDGVYECHEVKGARAIFRDDARVKIKVAAQRHPFRFLAAYPVGKLSAGAWEVEAF